MYAAPEVLDAVDPTEQSDLASLGYTLVEMLAGRPPFAETTTFGELIHAKSRFPEVLPDLLPEEVRRDEMLVHFCRRLVATDPAARFPTAEDADLDHTGAAGFQRHLVKHDLSSEYSTDIRRWLTDMGELQ
jgi:serine/threonine-protein kinase